MIDPFIGCVYPFHTPTLQLDRFVHRFLVLFRIQRDSLLPNYRVFMIPFYLFEYLKMHTLHWCTAINIITCFIASALFSREMFCSSKFKIRTTNWFPYESTKEKRTNWNFFETFQHWLIRIFIFCCACYELLFLLLFPRNATPISAPVQFHYYMMRIERNNEMRQNFSLAEFLS